MVNHSVPELFVKLDGRCGGLGQLKEHTAEGNRLGISFLTLCRPLIFVRTNHLRVLVYITLNGAKVKGYFEKLSSNTLIFS